MLCSVSKINQLLNFLAFTAWWFGIQLCRIFQQVFGKFLQTRAFQRRGEQHGLFAPAGFSSDTINITDKAHIQHAVSFIKHQNFNITAVEAFIFNVLHQTTGGRDDDIDSFF